MSTKKVIGIVGIKNSGKTMIGNYISNEYRYRSIAFATPLKKICSSLFNKPYEDFEHTINKEHVYDDLNVSPRQLMQVFGTELLRTELFNNLPGLNVDYNNIWIHYAKNEMKEYKENIVITDVRFDDECQFIKDEGGYLMYVNRFDGIEHHLDSHESERAHFLRSKCDVIIDNVDNSIDLTFEQVDAFMHSL